jgi:hypothetical protein
VLKDGKVIQRGKHTELLEQEGLYRQIFDLELRDQEENLARVLQERQTAAAALDGNGRKADGAIKPPSGPGAHAGAMRTLDPRPAPGGGGAQ